MESHYPRPLIGSHIPLKHSENWPVSLKSWLGSSKVTENGAVRQTMCDFLSDGHRKYSSILYHFRVIWRWIISWPWNLVRGHSRSLKLVPFKSLGMVSYLHSIVTMALSCIMSETKRYRSKSWFFTPILHSTPPLWGSPSEYCHTVRYRKTRMVWLSDCEKCLRIHLAILTEYRHVTNTWRYIQTDRHLATAQYTQCITSHSKNKTTHAQLSLYLYITV